MTDQPTIRLGLYEDGRINVDMPETDYAGEINSPLYVHEVVNDEALEWVKVTLSRRPDPKARSRPGVGGTLLADSITRRYGFWGTHRKDQRQISGKAQVLDVTEDSLTIGFKTEKKPRPLNQIFSPTSLKD